MLRKCWTSWRHLGIEKSPAGNISPTESIGPGTARLVCAYSGTLATSLEPLPKSAISPMNGHEPGSGKTVAMDASGLMGLFLTLRERLHIVIKTLPNERRLRRELAAEGFRLWKVREDSQYYFEYGPYSVLDKSTRMVMTGGCSLNDVQHWLSG